jgi:hypothetical protein
LRNIEAVEVGRECRDVPVSRPCRSRRKLAAMRAALAAIRRMIRAVKILARNGRIPKPLRWLAAFGLLPIPGPVDEAVLLIVGLLLWVFYREPLRAAWSRASDS